MIKFMVIDCDISWQILMEIEKIMNYINFYNNHL